jgi:hypothetical protein
MLRASQLSKLGSIVSNSRTQIEARASIELKGRQRYYGIAKGSETATARSDGTSCD